MGEQSAARLEGDRYQHLFSWHIILNLIDPQKGIESVWIEHPHAGAADDVTVEPQKGSKQAARYYQIKWHRDYSSGYSMSSLMERAEEATSLLEKFWKSWQQLKPTGDIELWLVSNWSIQPGDPLGLLIQARDHKLKDKLLSDPPRSTIGQWRKKWQDHLGADNESFMSFYRSLRFQLGYFSLTPLPRIAQRDSKTR